MKTLLEAAIGRLMKARHLRDIGWLLYHIRSNTIILQVSRFCVGTTSETVQLMRGIHPATEALIARHKVDASRASVSARSRALRHMNGGFIRLAGRGPRPGQSLRPLRQATLDRDARGIAAAMDTKTRPGPSRLRTSCLHGGSMYRWSPRVAECARAREAD